MSNLDVSSSSSERRPRLDVASPQRPTTDPGTMEKMYLAEINELKQHEKICNNELKRTRSQILVLEKMLEANKDLLKLIRS